MGEAWIIDVARTPRGVGKVDKGGLANVHPQRILSTVLKALAERNGLNTAEIDDVIAGCGTQSGKQGSCIARMAALDAGFDVRAPGMSLDRFCGSGLTAVNLAAMGVMSGALEGFTRDDVDKLALESQRRAAHALANGYFSKSLISVYHDDGSLALATEEYPRPQTTLEGLGQLKAAFAALYDMPLDEEGLSFRRLVEATYPDLKINHVHHAGNSSGVVDGAGAVVIASPEYAMANGLKPRARIRSIATMGDSPELMLNAQGAEKGGHDHEGH